MKFILISSVICATFAVALSCQGDRAVTVPVFDGDRAFTYLEAQVAFGPRIPGSPGSARCREYLLAHCRELGGQIDTMSFLHVDKYTGKSIEMTNVLARFIGSAGPKAETILLAAHYDTRPRADYDPDSTKKEIPIAGANDGASGVAVLMELANLISSQRPEINVELAFLDGEDYGKSGDLSDYFLGAKEMTRRGIKGKYKLAVVIDMIGEKDLRVYRESYSEQYFPELNEEIWQTAHAIGETTFSDTVGYFVHDDHLSFMTVGLPSVVLIDFAYQFWHTSHDTVDKCSPGSLASVGRVLAHFIYSQ